MAEKSERFVDSTDGVRVAVYEEGNPEGPTIVLVHGWPDSHVIWDGVVPLLAPDVASTDEMLGLMDRVLVNGGYLNKGELVVFVAGQPVGRPGTTNLMKLHRIGIG